MSLLGGPISFNFKLGYLHEFIEFFDAVRTNSVANFEFYHSRLLLFCINNSKKIQKCLKLIATSNFLNYYIYILVKHYNSSKVNTI
jgi:hypothetical protein